MTGTTTSGVIGKLRARPFMADFGPEHLERLAALASEVEFEHDQIIFEEGDGKDVFYLLLTGSVALEIHAPHRTYRVQVLGEGEELGWSAALPQSRKYFQARALKKVHAIAFPGPKLREMWEAERDIGYLFARRLLAVVAQRSQATQIQLLDLYGPK